MFGEAIVGNGAGMKFFSFDSDYFCFSAVGYVTMVKW